MKENINGGYPCDHAVVDAYNTLGGKTDPWGVTLIHKNIFEIEPALVELLGGYSLHNLHLHLRK